MRHTMIETVEYKRHFYPKFQTEGNASQFAIPFALHVCKGYGYDIGCMKQEWSFPGSVPIDLSFDNGWEANNLPHIDPDYIFSSHCLEHVPDWIATMDYWYERLRKGGTLFLYLPDFSQVYWRPWNNYKHKHVFTPEIIESYMFDRGYKNIFVSGIDMNNSFMIMGEK